MENLLSEGRYDRQELITWWDQNSLRSAQVLVVGAGALGNEVVKNLTLLGVGNITVVDMDTVSTSNLSRCVFFREGDEGKEKAILVAERASELNPDVQVEAHVSYVQSKGVGWVRNFNLVIGCLDNREARVWVNQACRKFGITWIDGAIEGIRGVVKVFPPSGACYECTLGEVDRSILDKRKACSLLSTEEVLQGKVPTTATTSSVVAGLQTQEAIRLLNGGDSPLKNKGWFLIGESFDTYTVDYVEDEWCLAHEDYRDFIPCVALRSATLRSIVPERIKVANSEIKFEEMLVRGGQCFDCGFTIAINKMSTALVASDIACPSCSKTMGLDATNVIGGIDAILDITVDELGLATFDVVTIRTETEEIYLALTGGGNEKL